MDYTDLLRLKKDAPLLVRQYEMRKRSINAQLLLLDNKRLIDPEGCAILSKWVSNNNDWLVANQEKYYQAIKLTRFTENELIELHHQQQGFTDERTQ